MNNRDYRYLELARQEALKSTFPHARMGAVIVYRNHVIGKGHNSHKTDPIQKKYNRYRNFAVNNECTVHSIHCEMAAIKSISYPVMMSTDWTKVTVYTYRICPGHSTLIGRSRPCEACMQALKELGVRRLVYTTNDGFAEETIINE